MGRGGERFLMAKIVEMRRGGERWREEVERGEGERWREEVERGGEEVVIVDEEENNEEDRVMG